tara:strand:+ start:63 stop:176 length:114 start_codon:yes stop_codon:yes gene_type:complete
MLKSKEIALGKKICIVSGNLVKYKDINLSGQSRRSNK